MAKIAALDGATSMRALLSWERFDADHGWYAETTISADQVRITKLLGPEQPTAAQFTAAVPTWSAETPAGSWIEVQLRARRNDRWTGFYRIAQWDSLHTGSLRRSFAEQRDEDGRVATDTLILAGPGNAIQPRVLLYGHAAAPPTLRALRLALSGPGEEPRQPHIFAPRELLVPLRSQMAYADGSIICSPTSVTMLLAYWYAQTGDERLSVFAERAAVSELVVPQVYDPAYESHGNWGFNTAFAASCGLDAYVARFSGFEQLEPWIAACVPVVISIAWDVGQLENAPIPASSGHLLVVTGFDERGRVIVADPRGESEREVRRVYDAAQLAAAWQNNSAGTAYLIHPHGWPTPPMTARD
jgi:hypothetical protein